MNPGENNDQMGTRSPPLPPPQLPQATVNAMRMTYINLFNQILDNSINVNCICKTTNIQSTSKKNNAISSSDQYPNEKKRVKLSTAVDKHTFFDRNNYLSDDDEKEGEHHLTSKSSTSDQQNDDTTDSIYALDYDDECTDKLRSKFKICDLSCFEKMRQVHNYLRKCFFSKDGQQLDPNRSKLLFQLEWSKLKFIDKCPMSCDYYGTTIFHYAATDVNSNLLAACLEKYGQGFECVDSKGMTPLMRAVQRNNIECVKYLLNYTKSDINGSLQSTYTPLWFAVSNGYNELALLLLNFNASASIVYNKNQQASQVSLLNLQLASAANSDDVDSSRLYLFSPLRASIVYSRFEIMRYLLEFNANVYEIFGCTGNSKTVKRPLKPKSIYDSKINEDYVSSLKFFYRQFPNNSEEKSATSKPTFEENLDILNEFIDDPNVYRRMMVEFVKNLIHRINSNLSLVDRLYEFLNSINKNNIDFIVKLNETINSDQFKELCQLSDYVATVREFVCLLEQFLNQNPNNPFNLINFGGNSIAKSNYNESIFDFSVNLMDKYFKPKSLKQLSRFKLREVLFERIESDDLKFRDSFLKCDELNRLVEAFKLPKHLERYVLFQKDN